MADRHGTTHPLRAFLDGFVLLAFLAIVCLPFGEWLGGRVDLGASLSTPSWQHPLGTDNLGRDLLVRVASALRGGVLPLWLGVTLGSLAGLGLALLTMSVAEARRTRGSGAALTLVDLLFALLAGIPVGLLAFAGAVIYERSGLLPVLLTLGGLFAVRTYLEARDLFRHDSQMAFWTAHSALGGALLPRLWRYGVLAGWKWPLLATLSFHMRAAVAIEASLSYLGFGIQEPAASFGNMLASHFDLYLRGRFEVLLIVALALLLTAAVPGAAVNLARRLARGTLMGSSVSRYNGLSNPDY